MAVKYLGKLNARDFGTDYRHSQELANLMTAVLNWASENLSPLDIFTPEQLKEALEESEEL